MGSSSGLAGLKCLQWLFVGIEFCCSVILLGVNSYFLATMVTHHMSVPTSIRAIEGISAVGTLYTALGILLVCACAGHPAPSFISIIFAIALAGGYIYIAIANRAGASSCSGASIDTVYGSGDAGATPSGDDGSGGISGLPTYQRACQMEMASLIAACVAILFFFMSIFLEIKLNRSRYRSKRPIRDADGEYISKSAGYGLPPQRRDGHQGFGPFHRLRGSPAVAPAPANPDMLPVQPQVSDMQTRRVEAPQWGEVSSLHDSDRLYFNDGDSRDEHGPPVHIKSTTAPRPAAAEYNEGEVGDMYYGEDPEDMQETDEHWNTGKVSNHRERKAARVERLEAF
ncbi:hypothetical protein GQ53DRAFT_747384 [Thozetella sp. PMI_491]|nr:hypothetical protein GQ53DRAFT_747384 [Thozetella sp. PMI_491]